jgi:hypothetical protein
VAGAAAGLPPGPRAGTADLSLVVPDATAALRGRPTKVLPLPGDGDGPPPRGVVVLVVDGLGRHLLDDHAEVAPTLTALPGVTLDAPFPTTTSTSLTTIGTGLAPGEHGIVGFSLAVPGDDRPLVTLTWSWERQDPRLDARDDVVPERLQPSATALEAAARQGLQVVTVLRPEFATSGLTRAGLRGGEVVTAAGLEDTLTAAVEAAAAGTAQRPALVYAHHGEVDTVGHLQGPGSDAWCRALAEVDAHLAALRERLPAGVAVVVTADHGMVHVPATGFVELADDAELLAGVRVLTGDARARQLHVHAGARDDVLRAWRARCGDTAHVVTRDEAIAAGWFGPRVTDRVRPLIGDVLVVAAGDVAWVHRDVDLLGGRLAGLHGALTRAEVEVPALVLQGGAR